MKKDDDLKIFEHTCAHVFSLKLTRFKIYNEFLHSIVPNQCMYFIYIIIIHFEFDSFQFIKHDLMMMMGEKCLLCEHHPPFSCFVYRG